MSSLFFLLETASPEFAVNEPDMMTARWATLDVLEECHPRMETWSQIVVDHVLRRLPVACGPR